MKVTGVIVSRLDHSLAVVVDSLARQCDEIIITKGDGGVFERWEAAAKAKHSVVYVQDDDAVVDVPAVLAAYEVGSVVCNMPPGHRKDYPDGIALVGWGCVFDKSLLAREEPLAGPHGGWEWTGAFDAYLGWCNEASELRYMEADPIFRRECDRVFTGLSPLKLVDVERVHLPQAHHASRMSLEPKHGACLQEIRRRIKAVREWMETK
jgi:hypothetical protein